MAAQVKVDGLSDFLSGVDQMRSRLPASIAETGRKAAALVAESARALGQSQGSVAAKAARSIALMSGQIVIDEPFGWGAEKGSIQYHQFKKYLGSSDDAGYFIAPAVKQAEATVEALYARMVDDLSRKAFPS